MIDENKGADEYKCNKCGLTLYPQEYPHGDMPLRHLEDGGVFVPQYLLPRFDLTGCMKLTSA